MSGGYYQNQHYPPQPPTDYFHQQQSSSYYSSDQKGQPLVDPPYTPTSIVDPVYPPLPANHPPYLSTTLQPSLSVDGTQLKPFSSSSIDLETDDGTTNGADGSVYPVLGEEKVKKDDETGIKAALWPNSIACRIYLIVVLVETIIDLVIEADVLLRLDAMADKSEALPTGPGVATTQTRQPVYLGIFALAHVLQMILAVDAVYNKNTLQFLFLAIFNFSLLIYGALQIIEVKDNISTFVEQGAQIGNTMPVTILTIAVPCVTGLAEIAYIALGWKIWKEFGWKVYKFLGADRNIKKMFAQYQVFECLLKFDIFFYVGFSVQWLSLVLVERDFEFYATVVALPVSLLLLVEGMLAARHESKWMMGSFMFGCVAGCAYFVYKAYKVFTSRTEPQFVHLWKSLLIFAALSIILLLMTFISATIVMLNFGKGLKTSLNKKMDVHKLERRGTEYKGGGRKPVAFNPKRMSIE